MTVFKNTDGIVVGQPMSPFFGAQNGQQGPGAITIEQPTQAPVTGGMQATGVQMSMLEACSRGLIPRNAQLSTIAGQSVSAGISVSQGDSVSVDEAFSSGNGMQVNLGVAVPPNANNNAAVETAGVNNQVFVEGIASAVATLATGPAATNIESVVSAPLPGSTTTANVGLLSGAFQG
jgi:hypothetical protein